MLKAILKDGKILCSRCMNVLGIVKQEGIETFATIDGSLYKKNTILEIKCKARKNGLNCNEINEIEL